MEKSDVAKPVTTTLNSSNYNLWVPGMKCFLIGRKLWRIVTGDICKPTKAKNETNEKFVERLEDWDSKNHQIITWFRNTSIPSIQVQFTDYNSAKEIWDFLANWYNTTGLAHYYDLWSTLLNLRQESCQLLNDFLAQVQPIWNQMSQAKISEDHLQLIQEIIFEETRLNLDKTPQFDTTLASTRSSHQKPHNQPTCKTCNQNGHSFSTCPTVECRYFHNFGHILEHCPIRPPRPKVGFLKSANNVTKLASPSIIAATTESSTAITLSGLEALLKQVQDPQTKKILGTGRRMGRLFELQSLHLPKNCVSAATVPSSTHQWHLRLGHALASKIQPLVSRGTSNELKIGPPTPTPIEPVPTVDPTPVLASVPRRSTRNLIA
ncbi:hypothetical protein SESBI_30636 [Sesbania bispinosa]|nr:hypothetical protein SESBI_30636 [Sesbania bispinosa]